MDKHERFELMLDLINPKTMLKPDLVKAALKAHNYITELEGKINAIHDLIDKEVSDVIEAGESYEIELVAHLGQGILKTLENGK